ncbi:MAG: hypothetical protein KDD60_07440, partial [Bdellovibrionales bacterium]|nr:hypothetical protein [Bdellovibrionales bacterium]
LDAILKRYGSQKVRTSAKQISGEVPKRQIMLDALDGDIDLLIDLLTELYEALSKRIDSPSFASCNNYRSPADTIDAVRLIKNVDGDLSILVDRVRDLCAEWAMSRPQLSDALSQENGNAALAILVDLHALLDSVCAPYAVNACMILENLVEENNYSEVPYYLRLLEAEIDVIVIAFQISLKKERFSLRRDKPAKSAPFV